MKVIRDKDGQVINIGPWDYCVIWEPGDNGEEIQTVMNPLPEGATEADEEVVTGWDGGFYVAGDPRAEGAQ